MEVSAVWTEMYHYAWFISFGVSFVVYLALTNIRGAVNSQPSEVA
jgi:cytosine/uracil/thiamine/allantoin permease